MYKILAQSPLFKGISEDEIEILLEKSNFKIRSFQPEQMIASRNEALQHLYLLIEGSVRGEMLDYSGKVLKVEDIQAPKPIASAFLFGAKNTFPVDVIANEETTIVQIPKDAIIKLFQSHQVFLKNYLDSISNRAQFLSNRIWFLSFKTIKGKLAQYILNLEQPNIKQIELKMTQQELSEFFGVTRPSLARALGEMEKDGIIQVQRRMVTIVNKERLIELLN